MIQVFSPQWFTQFDIFIELFSFMILATFFIMSIKNYKLSGNKKTLTLGIGFLLIALAEIAAIMTKFVLYYPAIVTRNFGGMLVTYHTIIASDILYDLGFFLHKLLILFGLYIIYRLLVETKNTGDILISVFFLILSAVAGEVSFCIFHLTTILLLSLIIWNYFKLYSKNKAGKTKILINAFILLLLAHIIFLLSNIALLYVIAQIFQLFSYLILLFLIIELNKNGEPKPRK
jgi:hypothetical protein